MSEHEKLEFEALKAEKAQRSGFQHTYQLLNITAAGAVLAFSLENSSKDPFVNRSLLIVPLLSFMLFMLWTHQAFVIVKISTYIRKLWPGGWADYDREKHAPLHMRIMRLATITIALLGNFVGIPLISIFVFMSRIAPN